MRMSRSTSRDLLISYWQPAVVGFTILMHQLVFDMGPLTPPLCRLVQTWKTEWLQC